MSTSTTAPAKSVEANPTSPRPGTAAETGSKAAPSFLSSDLTVEGDLISASDIAIEGRIEGNCQARLVTVGEDATIKGELVADDVVVQGRVIGRLRGLKVRLSASAHVEGDIIHKTLAVESGAHFEGSVQRQDDPLSETSRRTSATSAGNTEAAGATPPETPEKRAPNLGASEGEGRYLGTELTVPSRQMASVGGLLRHACNAAAIIRSAIVSRSASFAGLLPTAGRGQPSGLIPTFGTLDFGQR